MILRPLRRSLLVLACLLVAGCVLSIGLSWFSLGVAQSRLEHEARNTLRNHLSAIETSLRGNLFLADVVAAYFEADEGVERAEFRSFAASLLRDHGNVQALEWVPRVSQEERRDFEERARRDGLGEAGIGERDGQGRKVAAGRAEYFPILFAEPSADNESSFLLDLGFPDGNAAAFLEARDTGKAVVTDRNVLMEELGSQHGLAILLPIYHKGAKPQSIEGRRRDLAGFVVAVLRIADIVRDAMAPLHALSPDHWSMEVRVFDLSAPAGKRLLYPKGAAIVDLAYLDRRNRVESVFEVAGRRWLVAAWPTAPVGQSSEMAVHWIILVAGVMVTILLTGLAWTKMQRTAERVAAEQALRQGERFFRSILDNSPTEIALKDADGRFLVANAALLKRLNVEADGFSGGPLPDLSPKDPDHRRLTAEHEWAVIASRAPIAQEREWLDIDGNPRTYLVTKFPILDDGGRVVRIGSIATEITERKRAERELCDLNRAYRTLSRCNEILVRSKDEGTLIADVCRTIVETGGYAGAEVGIAQPGGHGATRPAARFGRVPDTTDILQIPWDGPACPIVAALADPTAEAAAGVRTMAAFPLLSGGRATGVLTVFSDAPDAFGNEAASLLEELAGDMAFGIAALRIKAEHDKAEIEMRKLARAVEQSPAMIIMTDAEGTIEYVNPKFIEVTGYGLGEAVGAKPSLLKSGETGKRDYEKLWAAIKEGREWRGLFHNKRKDGSFFWGEAAISPVLDGNGRIAHFIGIQEDVTERLETESRLRHADKMDSLGNLAGGIAHDFNNMLLPIGTLTEMVLKEMEPESKAYRRLERVLEATQRAQSLARQILSFGRTDEGEVQTQGISEIILETVNLLKSTLPKTIALEVRIEPDLGAVECDRAQIETVILNLAKNAADAMGRKPGDLRIVLERVDLSAPVKGQASIISAGSYALLTLGDTGKGIDADTLAKIFEPYFTTKAKGEGTGLGLAMVRTIILKHGGEITVESQVGVGTTFQIYLPLRGTSAAEESGKSAAA